MVQTSTLQSLQVATYCCSWTWGKVTSVLCHKTPLLSSFTFSLSPGSSSPSFCHLVSPVLLSNGSLLFCCAQLCIQTWQIITLAIMHNSRQMDTVAPGMTGHTHKCIRRQEGPHFTVEYILSAHHTSSALLLLTWKFLKRKILRAKRLM